MSSPQHSDDDSALIRNSETTSIESSMYKGYVENGRRYQTVRENKYWGPSDEQQFETFEAGHLMYQILDSQEENTLFRSPIPENAQVFAIRHS